MSRRQREGAYIGKWRRRHRRSKHLVMGDRRMPEESMHSESDWIVTRRERRSDKHSNQFQDYDGDEFPF